jgi:stearoyl-CoA desaturase (Delta-9 desaturase)
MASPTLTLPQSASKKAPSSSDKTFAQRWFGWLDSDYFDEDPEVLRQQAPAFKWSRTSPFVFMHLGCLGLFWCGVSATDIAVCIFLYWSRMFLVTGIYHRYFAHRAFKTSRFMQFLFAFFGLMIGQRGPLWWASNHRHHHRYSDMPEDLHSPKQGGFWWSHMGWLMSDNTMPTDYKRIQDFAKFPELVLLNRFDWTGSVMASVILLVLGAYLEKNYPQLGTNAYQLWIWGFFVSTTFLFHGTVTINSLSHVWGNRRFETKDTSRNNFILALITMGEGWHNNHHYFPGSARQGLRWWEVDATYYILKMMSWVGLVWDLQPPLPSSLKK